MHGVMIAIEYSYKLDRKNYFNLWCELGRLLLRQSHISKQAYMEMLARVSTKDPGKGNYLIRQNFLRLCTKYTIHWNGASGRGHHVLYAASDPRGKLLRCFKMYLLISIIFNASKFTR